MLKLKCRPCTILVSTEKAQKLKLLLGFSVETILAINGFDESLWPSEDVDLDYRLKKKGYRFMFNSKAVVYHYRAQSIINRQISSGFSPRLNVARSEASIYAGGAKEYMA